MRMVPRDVMASAAAAAMLVGTLALCPTSAVAAEATATEPVREEDAVVPCVEDVDAGVAMPGVEAADVADDAAPAADASLEAADVAAVDPMPTLTADDDAAPADDDAVADDVADDIIPDDVDGVAADEIGAVGGCASDESVADVVSMPVVAAPGTLDLDEETASKDVPLHQLRNPGTGEYLFTASDAERDCLSASGWVDEGSAWLTPGGSTDAVFRLVDPSTGERHYVADMDEYLSLVAKGWEQDGMAWYVAEKSDVPIYSLHNANTSVGTYYFTSDASERLTMVTKGWTYEGVTWYGVDTGPSAPAGAEPETWVDGGGSRFYIQADGTPATGWQTIGEKRYHFDGKGRVSTGIEDVSGVIYNFNADGTAASGWRDLSGYRYYFNADGSLKHDGWFTTGGNTYYLDPTSGAMQTKDRWIDGVLRPFASNGVCLKIGYQTSWGGLTLAARNVTLPSYTNGSYWSYVHPCIISPDATRAEVIEAFISVAYEYMYAGTRWVDNNCGAPGTTVDCTGLVMEALYAVGMDLTGAAGGDYNPYSKYYWNHHFANTWRLNNTFQPISISELERGDIIYYEGHVVIYLGNGMIIESTSDAANVRVTALYYPYLILGCARPFTK